MTLEIIECQVLLPERFGGNLNITTPLDSMSRACDSRRKSDAANPLGKVFPCYLSNIIRHEIGFWSKLKRNPDRSMDKAMREIDPKNIDPDIDPRVRDALHDAAAARLLAYAPYSGFKMGAAVVTDKNEVVRGTLIENVSLGLAMCSERAALFATVANQSGRPEVLALESRRTGGQLTWPCGACLQVAMELSGPELLVVTTDGKTAKIATLGELAPNLPNKN